MTETPSVSVVRGGLRRLLALAVLNHWLLVFFLFPLMLWTALTLIAPVRTIQIEARTLSAQLTMIGGPQPWDIRGARVCLPAENPLVKNDGPCGDGKTSRPDKDDTGAPLEVIDTVGWETLQKLNIIWTPDALRIILQTPHQFNDTEVWPARTELRLPPNQVIANGALTFAGKAVIGEQMQAGATNYLIEGNYYIFERGLSGDLFGLQPDVTRQGALRRGDEVEIICRSSWLHTCEPSVDTDSKTDNNASSTAQAAPSFETKGRFTNAVSGSISMDLAGKPGLHVVALSEEANSLLKIASAGRDKALEVKPNWLQRAAVSSSLVAISIILALWAPVLLAVLDHYRKT